MQWTEEFCGKREMGAAEEEQPDQGQVRRATELGWAIHVSGIGQAEKEIG
jgi:hypothetical protein